jgi:hypothetical protein
VTYLLSCMHDLVMMHWYNSHFRNKIAPFYRNTNVYLLNKALSTEEIGTDALV